MGNAALMLRSLGHEVCGADQRAYPPMSDLLAKSGVRVYEGYDVAALWVIILGVRMDYEELAAALVFVEFLDPAKQAG